MRSEKPTWEERKLAARPGDKLFRWSYWAEHHLPKGHAQTVFRLIKNHEKASRTAEAKIETVYRKVYDDGRELTPQRRQQRLGAVISRINVHLRPLGFVIKPGVEKRTYRFRRLRLGE